MAGTDVALHRGRRPEGGSLNGRWAVPTLALALMASCGNGSGRGGEVVDRPPETWTSEQIETGAELYRVTCSVCHGMDGKGGIGASLIGVAKRRSVEEHAETVRSGRRSMPAFAGSLSPEEIQAVVAYERVQFEED
jgi:mono/diheme cytochrome c family protein